MKITAIHAYEILASGGYPTIEVHVHLDSGEVGVASVPYGASAGSHEASVITDGDPHRYNGKGMMHALQLVTEEICPHLIDKDVCNQQEIDQIMINLDGTAQKTKLGGNAILAVSLAVARAGALAHKKPLYKHLTDTFSTYADFLNLPQPMAVVIEGGKHADHSTDLQEYCFSVLQAPTRAESIRMMLESYHALEKILQREHLSTNVGNEGAFAPNGITSNEAPFHFMIEAVQAAGYAPGRDISFSIDAASSEFYRDGRYNLTLENRSVSAEELMAYFGTWLQKYPIITMEDMLAEDDWDHWPAFKQMCDQYHVALVGDDLTVTNKERLQKAIDLQAISSILIKLNQIGTVTETMECCLLAKHNGLSTIPSHRGGGETNDTFMVDLAVAVGASFIKVGPTRGERISKYNRLMEIERQLRTS